MHKIGIQQIWKIWLWCWIKGLFSDIILKTSRAANEQTGKSASASRLLRATETKNKNHWCYYKWKSLWLKNSWTTLFLNDGNMSSICKLNIKVKLNIYGPNYPINYQNGKIGDLYSVSKNNQMLASPWYILWGLSYFLRWRVHRIYQAVILLFPVPYTSQLIAAFSSLSLRFQYDTFQQ
jgi:hypothetical protein